MPEHKASSRKTITVPSDVHDRLDEVKRESESWGECLVRLAESTEGEGECAMNTDVQGVGVDGEVYEEIRKLQELVEQTPSRTVDLMEGRFR